MFYAIFLLYFISRRWLTAGLLTWAALILIGQQVWSPSGWLKYPLSVLNIDFMWGVLAAWVVKSWTARRRTADGWGWVVVAGVLVACLGLALIPIPEEPSIYPRILFAFGLALLIVGCSVYEQSVKLHWPSFLLLMGNASYSIYLVHGPLLSLTQRLAGYFGLAWWGGLVFGVVCSVLAGYTYYLAVERPVLRFIKKHSKY